MTMTPEEKAVIQAAISASRTLGGMFDKSPLAEATRKLIYSCNECNTDQHRCFGCGAPIGHGDTDCGMDCTQSGTLTMEQYAERESIRRQLEEIGQDIMQEWMRIVDLGEQGTEFQARVRWQNDSGECIVGEGLYGEEYGRFRLTVRAEDLGPVPLIGPENDLGVYSIDERPMHWGDDSRTACGKFSGMVYQYTDDQRKVTCTECLEVGNNQPVWVKRTMTDVRPGDMIRPAGKDIAGMRVTARCWPPATSESKQTARDRGSWHVVEGSGGHWDDHVLQPGECCVHLDGAGHRLFKPTFAVEIQLTPSEVAAIELLGWNNRERLIQS